MMDKTFFPRVFFTFAALCCAIWLGLNCHTPSKPFHGLKADEVEWTTYENSVLPYTLS